MGENLNILAKSCEKCGKIGTDCKCYGEIEITTSSYTNWHNWTPCYINATRSMEQERETTKCFKCGSIFLKSGGFYYKEDYWSIGYWYCSKECIDLEGMIF